MADRVAQTVAAMALEARTESIFHPDSYAYRLRRGALDALATCRRRCWEKDWVIDLDVAKFFDTVDHDLMVGSGCRRSRCEVADSYAAEAALGRTEW